MNTIFSLAICVSIILGTCLVSSDDSVPTGFPRSELSSITPSGDTHEFQAEVSKLLDILINSLYSNREIFLRELISNAADALDKIRFISLTDPSLLDSEPDLGIHISVNSEQNTLTIRDSGIGMTEEELVKNLGSIAKSGTSEFVNLMKSGEDSSLIGQFGVGFYSAFLVSDRVVVASKSNDSPKQYVWESDAAAQFVVSEDPRGVTLGRGTEITLFLKEDASRYSSVETLEGILKKYSQFINFPIFIWSDWVEDTSGPYTVDVSHSGIDDSDVSSVLDESSDFDPSLDYEPEPEEEDEEPEDLSLGKDDTMDFDFDEEDEDEEEEEVLPPEFTWKQLNTQKPIWVRDPSKVEDEEYQEFYKTLSKDANPAETWSHFVAQSDALSFSALLYIPSSRPFQLFDDESHARGIKLFVRRVFISDSFSEFIPRYLNFVKGIVDSDDLPLNVNREMLSESGLLKIIRRKITRKLLGLIHSIQTPDDIEDPESVSTASARYLKFWKNFGTNLKLGIVEDVSNRKRLSKLLLFASTFAPEIGGTSLEDYVSRAKKGQKSIYYLAGESLDTIKSSPLIETIVSRGYEVLLLDEPIDEYCISNIKKFHNMKFVDVSKEGLELDSTDAKISSDEMTDLKKVYSRLIMFLRMNLVGKIEKVEITDRLESAPAILTTQSFGYSANMERLAKTQALTDDILRRLMASKKNMEINPVHPLVISLAKSVMENPENPVNKELALLLYETARLTSGFEIESKPDFVSKVQRMMSLSIGAKPSKNNLDPENTIATLFRSNALASEREQEAAHAAAAAREEEEEDYDFDAILEDNQQPTEGDDFEEVVDDSDDSHDEF